MRNIVLKMTARFLFLIVAGLSFICGCDKAGEEQPVTDSLSSFETAGASDEPAFDSKVKKVIILAGQSNAVGYTAKGHLYESPELFSAERLTAMSEGYDRIQIVFRNNSNTNTFRSENSFKPVTFGYGLYKQTCFGPEVGLAEYLSKIYPEEDFYIIKCAAGGSSLHSDWNPLSSPGGRMYDELLIFTENEIRLLEKDGGHVEIISFCWMQGEADTAYPSEYGDLFESLIDKFESKFSDNMPENGMAVIQAGISRYWQGYAQINAVKEKYASDYENGYYFSTYDLTYDQDNSDYAHYDAASMVILGNRFGEYTVKHLYQNR